MKAVKFSLLIICLLVVFSSCERVAGKGGKAAIHVTTVNGPLNTSGVSLRMKYGATSFPGENVPYDEDGFTDYAGDYTFNDLKRGDYYIYGKKITATDTLLGGAHVLINNKPGETHVVIDFAEEDPF
ncbi:MAG TPA: hypothetical protein DCD96_05645 [Flavobacteriales bacterium]|nr:hypothetical protein [Flavobacteriales bacterium]HRE73042.1 hypothetical protein [Flavobacteriales bacterium]HRJ36700.1 hypothetical protein [Flavobacteriales bacterium]HRJ37743.1 hypothetical protein [Flavobacteriales bacterium]